ncbi:MAG: malectin domain-containing carbohydrate-binding protein, partial [Pseudomonadota bacterium]
IIDVDTDAGVAGVTPFTATGDLLAAIQGAADPMAIGLIGTTDTTSFPTNYAFIKITGLEPLLLQTFTNLETQVGSAPVLIQLGEFFDDDEGLTNLSFTATSSDPAIGTTVNADELTLTIPASASNGTITVTATDSDGLMTMATFTVTVSDEPVPLLRLNSGNSTIPADDAPNPDWISVPGGAQGATTNGIVWSVNTGNQSTHNITGRDSSVPAYVPQAIFNQEKWDPSGGSELQYFIDLPNGTYLVRLYMGNGFGGTSAPGQRVFDINIEGALVEDNLDLSATLGHQVGGMFEYPVTLTDGTLNIEWIHQVENPLVNAVEILSVDALPPQPIVADPIANQADFEGDTISLQVNASGGDGPLTYAATDLPTGLSISMTTGEITGTIAAGASALSPFPTAITVDDADGESTDVVTINLSWSVAIAPITVAPPGNQFSTEGATVNLPLVASGGAGALSYQATGLPPSLTIDTATGVISGSIDSGAAASSPYSVSITVDDSDGSAANAETVLFTWNVSASGSVIYRVNAGGPLLADVAGDWEEDQAAPGNTANGSANNGTPSPNLDLTPPAIDSTFGANAATQAALVNNTAYPDELFFVERFSTVANPDNMQWDFPVTNGAYTVNLLFAELFFGNVNQRVFDVEIEGVLVIDDLDQVAEAGQTVAFVRSFQTTVTDGNLDIDFLKTAVNNPAIKGIEIISSTPANPNAQALIAIDTGSGIDSSTFGGDFVITNTSLDGSKIVEVVFDLSTAIYPNMVFDPNGTAGDVTAKCLIVEFGDPVGFNVPADNCVDPFAGPRGNGGFDRMSVTFSEMTENGFEANEQIVFQVDVDPTSIEGAAGAGGAGSVSGLELAGSIVTVVFDDGTLLTEELFQDSVTPSAGESLNTLAVPPTVVPPTLEFVGLVTPTPSPGGFLDATVGSFTQTVRITAPGDSDVRLLVIESDVEPSSLTLTDPFEANTSQNITDYTASVGTGASFVDIPITLTDISDGGSDPDIHYIAAVIVEPDLRTSRLSDVWRVIVNPLATADLTGTVAIQGIANPTGVVVNVDLYQVGAATPSFSFTPTLNAAGEFTITGVDPEAYEIAVKAANTLQVVDSTITLAAGANTADFGTLLAGDANDDNEISALDFSVLSGTFNLSSADAGYDG